jgi:hypothetical protein
VAIDITDEPALQCAELAARSVHILQAAVAIIWRRNAEIGLPCWRAIAAA